MNKRLVLVIILMIVLISQSTLSIADHNESEYLEVLILNSYHEGYEWSDDIIDGIKIGFAQELKPYKLTIEYMDTKNNISDSYLESLDDFLSKKYMNKSFDVIITCDDYAYNYMRTKGQSVFKDTPFVFCGVNYYDASLLDRQLSTGIIEGYDIDGTLKAALDIDPNIKNIYFINDKTLTGLSIEKTLREYIDLQDNKLHYQILNNMSMNELEAFASQLSEDSILFYCVYFRDSDNVYFDYIESVKRVSKASSVPVYGMWEFQIGNGIVGGNLTSGYYQGELAADYALQILNGTSPQDLKVVTDNKHNFQYDYQVLERFDISPKILPANSKIINQKFDDMTDILVLHSYDSKMPWVQGIEAGIESILKDSSINIIYDYMDTKRVGDPTYLKKVYEQMLMKHSTSKYDMVIVSDNNAFVFALKYGQKLFENIPIVFCGVNNFSDYQNEINENMTGVVENIDIQATVELAILQNPQTRKVYIINDQTPTGKANQKLMEELYKNFDNIEFEYLTDYSMTALIDKISTLEEDSIITLLSFTKDNSNNVYSYEKAGKLISEAANRPVYVVWDFYLNTGVVGGVVTSGYTQGETAGQIGKRILDGESIIDIPVNYQSPNQILLDYNTLIRFAIDKNLVKDSLLINEDDSFLEKYWGFFLVLGLLLGLLILVYLDSKIKMLKSKQEQKLLEQYASYDQLTKIYTRRKGLLLCESLMESKPNNIYTLCFIDLDNLKIINDEHGHDEGDQFILDTVNLIKKYIRESDVFFRYGGDEFIILFNDISEIDAENIMARIYHEATLLKQHSSIKIEFSYGLRSNYEEESLSQLIIIADNNMYEHKSMRKKLNEIKDK